jgi:RsiW-degrading membrane proteinase PrsW (M82 family)
MDRRTDGWRRRAAGGVALSAGLLALLAISALSEAVTRNLNLLPGLMALGAFAVPISFVALVRNLLPGAGVPLRAVVTCFLSGGVVGTAAASVLEYDALRDFGVVPSLLVGAFEEPAKLLVPLVAFTISAHRRTADGLVLGVTAGMGFAAFETMGYALGALVASHGGVGATENVLVIRGVLSPCCHPAWTGVVCAALWWARNHRGRNAAVLLVPPAALLTAVLLHGAWDGYDAVTAQAAAGIVSLLLLLLWLVIARREPSGERPRAGSPRGRFAFPAVGRV